MAKGWTGGAYVGRKNVAIGLVNRVKNQAIADEAAIYEDVDSVAIRALDVGAGDEAGDRQRGFFFAGFELVSPGITVDHLHRLAKGTSDHHPVVGSFHVTRSAR